MEAYPTAVAIDAKKMVRHLPKKPAPATSATRSAKE
jgi:hypothetical protein